MFPLNPNELSARGDGTSLLMEAEAPPLTAQLKASDQAPPTYLHIYQMKEKLMTPPL